jgi:hypothetical protein
MQTFDRRQAIVVSLSCISAMFLSFSVSDSHAARILPLVPVRAPLLTPYFAPWTLRAWQPIEFSIASAPEAAPEPEEEEEEDISYDDVSYAVEDADNVADVDMVDYDESSSSSATPSHIRDDWRDVKIEPRSAAVSFKRQGWTGFGIESAFTATVSPP